MNLSLRYRMILTLLPLLALIAFIGGAAVLLLYRLSSSIDAILRENYDSVVYMEKLKGALQRIDRSFPLALSGHDADARRDFDKQWLEYLLYLKKEQNNVTVPGEQELVDQLTQRTDQYHAEGSRFYLEPGMGLEKRRTAYFDSPGGLEHA